jgi:hypothetical protein
MTMLPFFERVINQALDPYNPLWVAWFRLSKERSMGVRLRILPRLRIFGEPRGHMANGACCVGQVTFLA